VSKNKVPRRRSQGPETAAGRRRQQKFKPRGKISEARRYNGL
jgi:hypothetical protein